MSEWQPIETAPLTGVGPMGPQIVCAHAEKRWIRFGRYYGQVRSWYYSGTNERSQYVQADGDAPTHWMPLPAPPATEAR